MELERRAALAAAEEVAAKVSGLSLALTTAACH